MQSVPTPSGGSAARKRPREEALPTNEEQRQLQNIDVLMKSNLYTLQTTELLSQVDATKKMSKKKFLDWLDGLQDALKDRESKQSFHGREVSQSWVTKQGYTGLELHNTVEASGKDLSFTFHSPSDVLVIGSQALDTVVSPLFVVDIAVVMPSSLFDHRDILNHIYFDKRKMYLAALWKTLQLKNKLTKDAETSAELYSAVSAVLLKADDRKPILQLQPGFSRDYAVRLVPVVGEDVFRVVQLRDAKNNVRPREWQAALRKKLVPASDLDGSSLPGTPDYNRAVMEDMAVQLQAKLLGRVLSTAQSLRQTLMLFKIWLTQRGLRLCCDGFDSHQASLLVAALVLVQKVNGSMAPFAAFSALLSFLADTDFAKVALDLTSTRVVPRSAAHGDAAMVLCHPLQPAKGADAATPHNATWRVSSSALQALQAEARQSLVAVQMQGEEAFDLVFMRRKEALDRADMLVRVPVPGSWAQLLARLDARSSGSNDALAALVREEAQRASLHMSVHGYLSARLHALLPLALADRLASFEVRAHFHSASKSLGTELLDHNLPQPWVGESAGDLVVGLSLDLEHCNRRVDKGPQVAALGESQVAEPASAVSLREAFTAAALRDDEQAFQLFYGPELCSMRRFKTGDIVHAVVWQAQGSGAQVVDEILEHLLPRHLPEAPGACIAHRQPELLGAELTGAANYVEAAEAQLALIGAVDELKAVLVNKLKSLPLRFDNLVVDCAAARYTALLPPQAHPVLATCRAGDRGQLEDGPAEELRALLKAHMGSAVSMMATPIRAYAIFEHSNKWPDDADAVERCKVAFLLQTKKALEQQFKMPCFMLEADRGCLYVALRGFLFRLLPFAQVDVERLVLRQRDQFSDGAELRLYQVPGLHHNNVKALAAAHPTYAKTVRALLLWRDLHYFSGHLSDEVVELLVAQDFLQPRALRPAATVLAGLHRALQRLAETNFEDCPVLVDFGRTDLSAGDRAAVLLRFRAMRAAQKAAQEAGEAVPAATFPSIYLVSSADKAAGLEPRPDLRVPEKVVLRAMAAAAQSSLRRLQAFVQAPDQPALLEKALGSRAILKHCDSVLAFHEAVVPDAHGPLFAQVQVFSNLPVKELSVERLALRPEGDTRTAAQFEVLRGLEARFGDSVLFFHSALRGDVLGVLLRPDFKKPVPFNVLAAKFRRLDGEVLLPNVAELMQSILLEGQGLLLAGASK